MADVLIAGAGIVGLLSAFELTKRGRRVTVIDAPALYPPASWAGGGILSPLFAWRYADPMNRLTVDAPARYRRLVDELTGHAGLRRDDLNDSGLWVAVGEAERERALAWARLWEVPCRRADEHEHPSGARRPPGVWFPEIGHIRNPRVPQALPPWPDPPRPRFRPGQCAASNVERRTSHVERRNVETARGLSNVEDLVACRTSKLPVHCRTSRSARGQHNHGQRSMVGTEAALMALRQAGSTEAGRLACDLSNVEVGPCTVERRNVGIPAFL